MHVLIIGGGGREHALAWKVAQSPTVRKVFVAPGNPGTLGERKVSNISIPADDIPQLLEFAQENAIDLTLVGPEAPLVLGITDQFTAAGLRCLGPTRVAAQLEGSKVFAKDFLARHHIPTADYGHFTAAEPAIAYIQQIGAPVVIKADGLAGGKGVVIAQTEEDAIAIVQDMLSGKALGQAGRRVVIEAFLYGEEASFIVLSDGQHVLPLATSQDHKARDNGDQGPNTGGMGAYSPAPVVTPALHDQIMDTILLPTVRGMAQEGHPYVGFLYAGLMITVDGPKVLEYNCRLGDPEAQPLLFRLQSDLVSLCNAALAGTLDQTTVQWDHRTALGVVMAAGGYPDNYRQGDIITGLAADSADAKLFHAGTRRTPHGEVVTQGGRVLCATALGETAAQAQERAYALAKTVTWPDVYYRTDIGHRALDPQPLPVPPKKEPKVLVVPEPPPPAPVASPVVSVPKPVVLPTPPVELNPPNPATPIPTPAPVPEPTPPVMPTPVAAPPITPAPKAMPRANPSRGTNPPKRP